MSTVNEKNTTEYDPYKNRKVENPLSYMEALMHLLKSAMGTGILGLGMAFSNSGLIFGIFLMIFISFLSTYCVHILVTTSKEVCKILEVPSLLYGEIPEKVFETGPERLRKYSKYVKGFVDTAMLLSTFAGSIYLFFLAETLSDFLEHVFDLTWSARTCTILVSIPILLIGQVRKLKHIAPFSLSGNLFMFIAFGITLYYIFCCPLTFSDKPLIVHYTKWPFAISTMLFSISNTRNSVSIQNEMEKPEKFLGAFGVLNMSCYILATVCIVVGFFGFTHFGCEVKGSITLNLPAKEPLALTAQVLIGFAILFSFGLIFHCTMEVIEKFFENDLLKNHKNPLQITLRTTITLMLFLLAFLISNSKLFLGLMGTFFSSTINILIPTMSDTVHRYPNNYGFWNWKLFMNIFLVLFYFFILLTGSTANISEIIKLYTY